MQQPQIVHEAEVHRQHVRLKIPIGVEIDGTRYLVDDWSMGGFGVAGPITSRQTGERFPVRLVFPFEDFELSLRLDAQMIYVDPDLPRFGCRFLALSQGQLSLFRYMVDAYLSGEIVTGADVLAVAGRDNTAEARVQAQVLRPFLEEEATGRRWRRLAGLGLLAALGVGLAGFIALGLQERVLTVSTDTAVIEAPIFRVRAPTAGTVATVAEPNAIVRPGDPVARVTPAAGGAPVTLPSPCECALFDWTVEPGQFAQQGEPVATLVAVDRPLVVRAQVPWNKARRLTAGQVAEIIVPGKPEPYSGQIDRVDFKLALGPRRQDDLLPADRRSATVIVRPDSPFDFTDLGSLVSVRFR
jgi:mannuronan synthase